MALSRSTYRYQPSRDDRNQHLRDEIVALAQQRRRYGYRRINAKRVWRIWQAEGLSLLRRRPRRRRPGERETLPTRAEQRGHVWTVDFVFDRTERGQVLKLLVVLDEYTRECHQIRVGQRLDSVAVCETLAELFAQHGPPACLRSDNGGEFIAAQLEAWLVSMGTKTAYIEPGHPWENG